MSSPALCIHALFQYSVYRTHWNKSWPCYSCIFSDSLSSSEFIVDEECILQLFKSCRECNRQCTVRKHVKGLKLVVHQSCCFCQSRCKWTNLPDDEDDFQINGKDAAHGQTNSAMSPSSNTSWDGVMSEVTLQADCGCTEITMNQVFFLFFFICDTVDFWLFCCLRVRSLAVISLEYHEAVINFSVFYLLMPSHTSKEHLMQVRGWHSLLYLSVNMHTTAMWEGEYLILIGR